MVIEACKTLYLLTMISLITMVSMMSDLHIPRIIS